MRSLRRLGCLAVFCGTAPLLAAAAQLRWEFERPDDLEGWLPNGHLAEVRAADGALRATVVDWDPMIVMTLAEPLAATPTQCVEIRIETAAGGAGELFWTGATEGKYGGFEQNKATPFQIEPGARVYRLRPFWQAEGRIKKLRLDLPPRGAAPAAYAIDYIRVVETGAAGAPVPAAWTFDAGLEGWSIDGEGALRAASGGLRADLAAGARLAAPPVAIDAAKHAFVSFRMATSARGAGAIVWAADAANGCGEAEFALSGDAAPRVYNVPVCGDARWRNTIVYLAIEPARDAASAVTIDWLRVTDEPAGEPDAAVERFFLADPLPRAGRICTLAARLANRGGGQVRGLRLRLALPEGARRAAGEEETKEVPPFDFYEPASVSWRVVHGAAGPARFALVDAATGEELAAVVERFLPALDLPEAAYVPEPKPVRGAFEVGVYYFPGWNSSERWQPLRAYPERTPVLGFYREGDPEVADWHIKFAVEHGITFFCYDWYWNRGDTQLTHALHDGYFKARYRSLLKFCLLWANHAPTVHSPEDNAAVCRYWIENYFRRPEYFKIDARPLLVIFDPGSMKRDLGIAGSREAIALWHRMTREGGAGEVLVAGCGTPGAALEDLKAMGFDAVTGYNWPTCGAGGRNRVPYAEIARAQYDAWWLPMARRNLLPVIVPASPGWDSRPWHGAKAFVQTERSPAAFAEHLTLAARFAQETASPRVVLIEAWNEWGEGSYCEPHKEYGFAHLDAVRRVFCPGAEAHTDIGPGDVGLGPYDVAPPPPAATAWFFHREGDTRGWSALMGIAGLAAADGVLRARTTTQDPALVCATRAPAREFTAMEIRMAVRNARPGDELQLFWRSPFAAMSEAASMRAALRDGGAMHSYRLDLGAHARWRGTVTQLRLDPCSTRGAEIAIESIRLLAPGS